MTSATSSRTAGNSLGQILAVDTSTAQGSMAIGPYFRQWDKLAMHSEVATLELQALLKDAGMNLPDVKAFVVNIGPGSFTGLRVGINLVRALAYSLQREVAMVSSLEALAFANFREDQSAKIAIRAIQNFYYAGAYRKTQRGMQTLVEPFSATLEEVRGQRPDLPTLVEENSSCLLPTDARTLVEMSTFASFSSWKNVKPLYVRASEAEEKLRKGILKPLP